MGRLKEMLKEYRLFQPDYIKANNRKLRVWNREQKRVGEGSKRYQELEEIKARFTKHLENVEIEREHLRQHCLREMQKQNEKKRAEALGLDPTKMPPKKKKKKKKSRPSVPDNIVITGPFRSYAPSSALPPAEKGNEKEPVKVKVVVKKKPKIVVKVKNPNLKEDSW